MSLWGRRIIDRIKQGTSSRIRLPVPPYGSIEYWDGAYSKLGAYDVFEWGEIKFEEELQSCRYVLRHDYLPSIRDAYGDDVSTGNNVKEEVVREEPFQNLIGVQCGDNNRTANRVSNSSRNDEEEEEEKKNILIIGCGNSTLGEDVLQYYLDLQASSKDNVKAIPKIIQSDVSSYVITSMTERYEPLISSDQMKVLQDDATELTLIEDRSIDAVIDKGLIDALFCADESDQMRKVMRSANRSLKVGKAFFFFSFSRPEFILQDTVILPENDDDLRRGPLWSHIDVKELENIFVYKFVKAEESEITFANTLKPLSLKGLQKEKRKRTRYNARKE